MGVSATFKLFIIVCYMIQFEANFELESFDLSWLACCTMHLEGGLNRAFS